MLAPRAESLPIIQPDVPSGALPAAASLPPGPSSRLLATLRFARDPYGYFAECRARYGDPFTLPLLGSKVVVTGRPDLVQQIYAMNPSRVGGLLGHLIPEVLGPQSLLVLSGERHATDRKLLMPMFHGERMAAWGRIIAEVTRTEAARCRPGEFTSAYEMGRAVTLEVILRALFGVDDPERAAALRAAVIAFARSGAPPLIFLPGLRRSVFGMGPWAQAQRRLADLDTLLYAQIEERRRAPGPDLLSMLLAARYDDGSGFSDEHIRDQLISLILAGHETMAVTIAWAMHWILSQPEVHARLDEELRGPGELSRMPFLDAVCNETLRIYPIQPIVMRHLLTPGRLGEHEIPAGAFVGAATTLVHMDPAIWPQPDRFLPQRFVDKPPGRAEFFPFGGGARRCIGAGFALYEMKVVIATLLREFRCQLKTTETPRPVRQSTVTGPSGGVPISLSR